MLGGGDAMAGGAPAAAPRGFRHPMHLHGHTFAVTDQAIRKDTINDLPRQGLPTDQKVRGSSPLRVRKIVRGLSCGDAVQIRCRVCPVWTIRVTRVLRGCRPHPRRFGWRWARDLRLFRFPVAVCRRVSAAGGTVPGGLLLDPLSVCWAAASTRAAVV